MNLSDHFTLEEFLISETAARFGLDNTPSAEITTHLRILAAGLEDIRALFDMPLIITSGYRCPELNTATGGSPTSAHMDGYAADFIIPRFGSPFEVAKIIRERLSCPFDQLIYEYGRWVHVSFAPGIRRAVLTKRTNAEPYLTGLVPCLHDATVAQG